MNGVEWFVQYDIYMQLKFCTKSIYNFFLWKHNTIWSFNFSKTQKYFLLFFWASVFTVFWLITRRKLP